MPAKSSKLSLLAKTLIVGEFKVGSLASSYHLAFKNLNLSPDCFCLLKNRRHLHPFAKNRLLHRALLGSYYARRTWACDLNYQIVEAAKNFGSRFVFFVGAVWILPATLTALRDLNIRTAIFNPDNPLRPHYNSRPETLLTFREVDLYLIWSRSLAEKLSSDGAAKAKFLPLAWDESLHPYMFSQSDVDDRAVFIGGWDKDREIFLNKIAQQIPLSIFGPDYWGKRTNPTSFSRRNWQNKMLIGRDLACVTSRSAISISFLRSQHYIDGRPDAVIMRTFEIPGSGGFILSTRSDTASSIFQEGLEAVYFSTVEEFIDKAKYYLKNPQQRFAIQQRAHKKTADYYRFEHNVARIESMLREI